MAQALDQPLVVIPLDELGDDWARVLQALKLMQVETVLFQRAHEPFCHPVALGLADKTGRDRHPEPVHFLDPGGGDILRAPVTANLQAAGNLLGKGATHALDTVAERWGRGPSIAPLRHMPALDFIGMVIHRAEEPAPALLLGVEPGG